MATPHTAVCPVHDEAFRRIEQRVESVESNLGEKLDFLAERLLEGKAADREVEARLKKLERAYAYLLGWMAGAGAVGGLLGAWFVKAAGG